MLTLNSPLKLDAAAIASPNLADRFDTDDLKRIGEMCWTGYDHDCLTDRPYQCIE